MSKDINYNDKFKDITYEQAVNTLSTLISELENGTLSFDDTLEKYKEAFEYYTFCSEYLKTAGEKIKAMNEKIIAKSPLSEE